MTVDQIIELAERFRIAGDTLTYKALMFSAGAKLAHAEIQACKVLDDGADKMMAIINSLDGQAKAMLN